MSGPASAAEGTVTALALWEHHLRRGRISLACILEVTVYLFSIKSLKILDGEDRYGLIIESEEDYDEDQVE